MFGLFDFFVPTSKIQKNRKILRDLDSQLATRCLKWVWLNLFVFLTTLIFSDAIAYSPILSYLGIVLFCLVCVVRSIMITRFEQLYGAGPAKWRNRFFVVTLANNCLWSAYVSFQIGIHEIGILSLMLVFYTASVANWYSYVFQGYIKLVRITLTILLLPIVVSMLIKMSSEGILIGLIFLLGYLVLLRESGVLHKRYWVFQARIYDLTEKNYELTRLKTKSANNHQFNADFLASIAYALRTPLNNLMGVMSLVNKTELTEENLDLHKITNHSVEQLVGAINDLLDYTKILNKKIVIEDNIFNLSRTIDQMMDDLSVLAHRKNVELIYDKTLHSLYRVKSDQHRLIQSISNVITYAINQSPEEGEVYVRFKMDRDGDRHSIFRVDISDQGQGLTEDEILKLFKPQYNVNQLDDHQLENFALGMAITKGMIEKMGGTVDACSISKKGTNYWLSVSLPLSSQQTKSKPTYNLILERKNFFLINANEHLQEVFEHRVANWNSQITSYSFKQLEELVFHKNEQVDCDLIFINLPFDQDELESCIALISEHKKLKQYRYVLLGTKEQCEMFTSRRLLGVNLLQKTFSPDQLQTAVTGALSLSVDADYDEQVAIDELVADKALNQKCILLVEDNKVNQLVVSKMLAKLGASVAIANHGEEALELLKEQRYDLILMDCQMPIMDGFETTDAIRKLSIKQMPIIALTAISTERCERKCYTVGMDDFLTKPVNYDDLQMKMTQWLHEYEETGGLQT